MVSRRIETGSDPLKHALMGSPLTAFNSKMSNGSVPCRNCPPSCRQPPGDVGSGGATAACSLPTHCPSHCEGERLYQKTVLGNGIRILTENIPHYHSISMGFWVSVGSRDELPHERGMTHLLEHMLFKGTARRSALDIAKELDAVGGFSNAFTSKEHLCFHAKVLDTHLSVVADVLTDIFLNSIFDPMELEREKQVVLQEIRMIEDTPDEYIHILFQENFWRGNPLGLPIYGSALSVQNATRDAMLNYLDRSLHPERILVAAAGNVDHNRFVELLAPALETLERKALSNSRVPPVDNPEVKVLNRDLEQVHLCLGMGGVSQVDPGRFACHMINVILGSSMSSRLFQEIREKRGLAYSVYSFLNSHEDTGLLGVYAGIGPDKVEECLKVIREQLEDLAANPISLTELSAAKEYLKGSMYLNAESTDSRMNRLAKNEFLFGRHVPFEEVEAKIDQVSVEDILKWFQTSYDSRGLGLFVLGPCDLEEQRLQSVLQKG